MHQMILNNSEPPGALLGSSEPAITLAHRASRLPVLTFMLILAILTVLPQIAFVTLVISSPETRSVLSGDPMIAVELALAAGFWALLVVLPFSRILKAACSERKAEIVDGIVHVVDRTPFSQIRWSLPVWAYDGIAHHVRSSLSGVRHELVLVHGDRRRNLVLASSPTISHAELARLCRLLEVPEVHAARIYGFNPPRPGGGKATSSGEAVTA